GDPIRRPKERSASSAGTHSRATSQNTARDETQVPQAPMSAAPTALPIAAKRALRPSRSATAAVLTSPNVTATSAGFNMQLANPYTAWVSTTGQNVGDDAINSALAPSTTRATASTPAFP